MYRRFSLEGNSFSELARRNTLSGDNMSLLFSTADFNLTPTSALGNLEPVTATNPQPAQLILQPDGTLLFFDPLHRGKNISFSGDDSLFGNGGNDRLEGNDGNDEIIGGDGDDILFGGNGDDVLKGGPGNDALSSGPGLKTNPQYLPDGRVGFLYKASSKDAPNAGIAYTSGSAGTRPAW